MPINIHLSPYTTLPPQVGSCPNLRERMHSSHSSPWEIKDRVSKGGDRRRKFSAHASSKLIFRRCVFVVHFWKCLLYVVLRFLFLLSVLVIFFLILVALGFGVLLLVLLLLLFSLQVILLLFHFLLWFLCWKARHWTSFPFTRRYVTHFANEQGRLGVNTNSYIPLSRPMFPFRWSLLLSRRPWSGSCRRLCQISPETMWRKMSLSGSSKSTAFLSSFITQG